MAGRATAGRPPGQATAKDPSAAPPPVASRSAPSAPSASVPKTMARSRMNGPKQSPRPGHLPDGREMFLRKPRSRRTWEPVTNHTCESCGSMYPRTPFDWDEVSSAPDGRRFCALKETVKVDTLKATGRFIRRLHPDFEIPPSLFVKDSPDTVRTYTSGNEPIIPDLAVPAQRVVPQPRATGPTLNLQPSTTAQPFPKSSAVQHAALRSTFGIQPAPTVVPSPTSSTSQGTSTLPAKQAPLLTMRQPTVQSSQHNAAGQAFAKTPTQPNSLRMPVTQPRQPRPLSPSLPAVIPSNRSQVSSRAPSNAAASGSNQRPFQVGPIRAKPSATSAPVPAIPRPSSEIDRVASQATEMLVALKRAFHRNPNPSPDVMDLLAATFNIADERVVPQLFESWRRNGVHLRSAGAGQSTTKKNGSKPASSNRKDFEMGSLATDEQRTPELAFNSQADQRTSKELEAEAEQASLFEQIVRSAKDGKSKQVQTPWAGSEQQELKTNQAGLDATSVHSLRRTDKGHNGEESSLLVANGILGVLDEPLAMEVGSVDPPTKNVATGSFHNAAEQSALDRPDRRTDCSQPTNTDDLRVVMPGMTSPPPQPHLAPATPPSTVNEVEPREPRAASGAAVPQSTRVDPKNAAALRSNTGSPALPKPPGGTEDAARRVAPLPSRAIEPPQTVSRSVAQAPPTILDPKPHEVIHFTDAPMQQAYEIFTSPEPHRLGNWLKATFRPASEKYSVVQKDIYTEYKSLFEGSPAGCWNGSQVVRLVREIFPQTVLGKRLDEQTQFRVWGLCRVRIWPNSPWDILYSGKLREGLNMEPAVPIEPFPSESNVSRVGAALESLASALSVARLDQTKMRDISDKCNKKDAVDFRRRIERDGAMTIWEPAPKFESRLLSHLKLNRSREPVPFEVVRKEKRARPSVKREVERVQQEIDKDRQPAVRSSAEQSDPVDGSPYRPLVLERQNPAGQSGFYPTQAERQPHQSLRFQSGRHPYQPTASHLPSRLAELDRAPGHASSQYDSSPHRQPVPTALAQPRARSPVIQSRWYQNTYQPPSSIPNSFLLPKPREPHYPSSSRAQHESNSTRAPQVPQQQALPRDHRPKRAVDPYEVLYANPPPFPQPPQ